MTKHIYQVIILNVNSLTASIKNTDWPNGFKKKKKASVYPVYERSTSDLGTQRLKVKEWKKLLHANRDQKKAG